MFKSPVIVGFLYAAVPLKVPLIYKLADNVRELLTTAICVHKRSYSCQVIFVPPGVSSNGFLLLSPVFQYILAPLNQKSNEPLLPVPPDP